MTPEERTDEGALNARTSMDISTPPLLFVVSAHPTRSVLTERDHCGHDK
jgi:hypothetical protein